jgi:hypothetical protein
MSNLYRRPAFGAKLKVDDYYTAVNQTIRNFRETHTLRQISEALTAAGWRTPKNLPWTRERLATYLQTHELKPTNEKEST